MGGGPDVRLRLVDPAPEGGSVAVMLTHTGVAAADLELHLDGGELDDVAITPQPRASRTELVLHAPDGQVRAVREAALGWTRLIGRTEPVELTGEDAELRGADALEQALATHLLDPLPDARLDDLIARPLPDGSRRVIVTTQVADLQGEAPARAQGPIHVLILEKPGFSPQARDLGALRRALREGGGGLRVASTVEDGQAMLGQLLQEEPVRSLLAVRGCRRGQAELVATGPLEARLPLGTALPRCAAEAPAIAPSRAAGPPWLALGGVAAGLAIIGLGSAWLLRRRRPASEPAPAAPAAPAEEAEQPGRILAPVDPDAAVRLIVTRGTGLVGSEIPLAVGSLTVGAARGNDALVDLAGISGRHARFECFPNLDVFVRDADSANGTWVHGRRLERSERVKVRDGDLVMLGPSLELVVQIARDEPSVVDASRDGEA